MSKKLKLNFDYDDVNDVLYASFGQPAPARTIEKQNGVLIRINPNTRKLIGFTILDYMRRVKDGKLVKTKEIQKFDLPLFV